ncbi:MULTISPECIES: hypothetical protein [unclassified Microbacterium]|uniref:hypothetical protein n=1 Tax=unclassified Microbacterium TaxID=2609290 RepID=UPI0025DF9721|nr:MULTISPECIES: hypothetical protein [unclassified Microbacterium]
MGDDVYSGAPVKSSVSTATDRQFQSAPVDDGFAPGRMVSMTEPSCRRSKVGADDLLLQREKKSN